MSILIIIIIILLTCLSIYAFATRKRINRDVDEQLKELEENYAKRREQLLEKQHDYYILEQTNINLYKEKDTLQSSIETLLKEKDSLNINISDLLEKNKSLETINLTLKEDVTKAKTELETTLSNSKEAAAAQQELTKQAFESYCNNLEEAYENADKKFEEQYQFSVQRIKENIAKEQKQLDEISATRAAAQQALLKEKEIKANADNYRLIPKIYDLEDIHKLELIKKDLHNGRILSMLIWQSYWQQLAKVQFPQILQQKTACGIYKITNIKTDECYIGQSVDIYKRWNEHCKCGLGIDTPPGNKLYKAMQEYGLENFTFELLAVCSKEELNSKEKYFIELYQAKEYGYNGTAGNN